MCLQKETSLPTGFSDALFVDGVVDPEGVDAV